MDNKEFNLSDWANIIRGRITASIKSHKEGKLKKKVVNEVFLPQTVKKKVPGASFSVRSGLGSFLRGKSNPNPEEALIEKEEKS